MTPSERQHVMDIAELQVNRYFDHYLTEVFPKQLGQWFKAHNQDVAAHKTILEAHGDTCRPGRMIRRWKWMFAGGSIVVGAIFALGTLVFEHWDSISKLLVRP